MYHLSEIPELKAHKMIEELKASSLWQKPIVDITEQDWLEFKNEHLDKAEEIDSLVLEVQTTVNLAKFLGQLEHERPNNIVSISR